MNLILYLLFAGLTVLFIRLAYLWLHWEMEVRKEEKINKAYREKREQEKNENRVD